MAHEIAELPQGAIRADNETVLRGVGETLERRLCIEAEMVISMFMRRDSHRIGAAAFKAGKRTVEWPTMGCRARLSPRLPDRPTAFPQFKKE